MSVGGGGRRPVRMCVRCDRVTSTPVLVSEVHAASGPGFNVYACAECAPSFPGPPDVFDLLEDGRRRVRAAWSTVSLDRAFRT